MPRPGSDDTWHEEPPQLSPQPWWSVDGPQPVPPRRPAGQRSRPAPPHEADWRTVRARLVSLERAGTLGPAPLRPGLRPPPARGAGGGPGGFSPDAWAHELAAPEVGCVLVAKQQGLGFFDGAVLLIAAHDDSQGSIGFVLNRPSALRLADIAAAGRSGAVAGVADVFGGSRLRVGGPVHPETLTALHGYGGCAGAQKICEVGALLL
ncbi:hypothetical protein Rsub_12870 [Raphidocelis subcapitata]|uniref:Uncharacterized protein n=1 Tax=Raphidocelis subcapitata TaxID=307507 RepID=A0A2V0PJS1_9CHLO|nr:hypothetical protein Rsub_12870 [Raphidocelis subcapitata]|eukprot:GBG00045.1 hypothetical protein Rsub_12870 [Raphidocelis subcapitata]